VCVVCVCVWCVCVCGVCVCGVCVCVCVLLIFVYCYTVRTLKSHIFSLYFSLIHDLEDDPMRNRNISVITLCNVAVMTSCLFF